MSQAIDYAWLALLSDVLTRGRLSSPRGKATIEMPQRTIEYDARRCVVTVPGRKLNYKFMAAEARWILSGDDTVAGVAPWNKNIAQFSDDGERFFGAYGPKLHDQLAYVAATLANDLDSRQAGLTFWRECPPKTKDVPCTVAAFFRTHARDASSRWADAHFFMRSSDAWLGVPYDAFNFAMILHLVCGALRTAAAQVRGSDAAFDLVPRTVHLTMASSHLYEMGPDGVSQWESAKNLVASTQGTRFAAAERPAPASWAQDPSGLVSDLTSLRDAGPGSPLRWWEGQ